MKFFTAGFLFLSILLPLTASGKDEQAIQALNAFNVETPGYGFDHHKPNQKAHYAMTYAIYASAALLSGKQDKAKRAADWLVKNSAHDQKYGWPFPFSYLSVGKAKNDSMTIYAPAQAFGIRALLDTYCVTGDTKYSDAARKALDYFAQFKTNTNHGYFLWYSDNARDNTNVPNSNALLMGQYARAARLFDSQTYSRIADSIFKNIWKSRFVNIKGTFWPYSDINRKKDNDALHHAFILQGLIEYKSHQNSDISLSRVIKFMDGFISENKIYKWHPMSYYHKGEAARLWDIGMMLYVYSTLKKEKQSQKLTQILQNYKVSQNKNASKLYFSTHANGDSFFPRQQAFATLALAKKYSNSKTTAQTRCSPKG